MRLGMLLKFHDPRRNLVAPTELAHYSTALAHVESR